MKHKLSLLVGLASLAALVGATAQTSAVTDPVGYITIDVAANTGGSGKLTLISPTLVEKNEFAGTGVVAANNLSVTFTGTTFAFAPNAYYLEVADTGFWTTITASTATSVTLQFPLPAGASASKLIIRKHATITSFLGANNAIGLKTGGDAVTADVVQFWNPTAQSLGAQYFYAGATEGVPPGWYTENGELLGTDVPDVAIFPGSSLVVTRRPNTATSLVSVGYVKTTPTQIPLVKGINIVGPMKATGTTLADSGLNTGNIATGLQQGTDAVNADTVQLAIAGIQYFAADPASGITGFVDENGDPPAPTALVKEGSGMIITRKPATAAVWTSPKTTVN
ncbi:MAG: hypothetical protein V4726_02180 [Verrucomicrobiota bacterium]